MRIGFIGDVVGKPGRRVVQQQLPAIRDRYELDVVIVNGENIAGGSGITPQLYQRLISYGVDGVTLGDHAFRQRDLMPVIDDLDRLARPANWPESAPGRRYLEIDALDGNAVVYVITVLGRLYMTSAQADDPYATVDLLLDEIEAIHPSRAQPPVVIVEIHGEATSEKVAMGHYFDGRVSAVVGTHTHIPTADAKILPGGTGYITDLGMTGPYDSVLGRRKDRVVQFMTTAVPAQFDVATEDVRLCGVIIETGKSGRTVHIERLEVAAEMDRPPFSE